MNARARVEALLAKSGLPVLVARPSFILGARDEPRPGEAIGAGFIDGCLSIISVFGGGRMASKYRSMSGDDLAAGLCALAVEKYDGLTVVEAPDLRRAARRWTESICGPGGRSDETQIIE